MTAPDYDRQARVDSLIARIRINRERAETYRRSADQWDIVADHLAIVLARENVEAETERQVAAT